MNYQDLSIKLIQEQYKLKNSKSKSILVIIGGIELTRKNQSIKKLSELMDPRYLKIKAETPNRVKENKLIWQPYINDIPKKGQIMFFYGNWYTDLLASTILNDEKIQNNVFNEHLKRIYEFESYLKNNNVDIIKVWFEVSWSKVKIRTKNIDIINKIQRVPRFTWDDFPQKKWKTKTLYNQIKTLRNRFTHDWVIINSENNIERNTQFSQLILKHLKLPPVQIKNKLKYQAAPIPSSLTQIKKSEISHIEYKKTIKQLERKVADVLRYSSHNVVLVFEGMDAAGKGGAIKRIVKKLDPREYEIHSIAAPERYELRRPYLWRFWNKLNDGGKITIFDRTWYGRVLVERIEGFASVVEWQRAYNEINRFEENLVDSQTVIVKIWLAISKDEQEVRFKDREQTPHKRFKITEEDWRNRDKWDDYLKAAADMFERTNTDYAPWYVIATDDKNTARIEVLKAILKQLKAD